MPGTDAKEKFVIFATAKCVRQIVADNLAICGRSRDSRRLDFCANTASLQDMAEVLHQPVTEIDGGGRRTDAGEARASVEPRAARS